MKTLLLVGTTLALLAAVNLSPTMAQGSKLSGGNTWPGISQRADPAFRLLPRQPLVTSFSTATTNTRDGGVTGCCQVTGD
jgi:hypothetical protein